MATSPTAKKPDWHLELSQGGTTVGFKHVSRDGRKDPKAFSMNPYPKMASKLAQGRSKYSDQNPPFQDVALSDFTGGRGSLHFDENKTKYFDGKRVNTMHEAGRVIMGPQENYIPGIRDFNESWPGDVTWQALYSGATTSVTTSFTSSAAYNAQEVVLILKKVGSPTGNVQVELLDAADSQLKTKSLTIGTDILTDLESERATFTFSSVQALSDATTYKVKITYSGGDSTNYVEVAVDGSTDLYYRVLDDTGDMQLIHFEYRGGFYCVTQPEDQSASDLYLLGYRGLADSNSGDKTKLNDGTQSWTTDALIGGVARIIAGPGVEEDQRWREITDNDGTSVTVSPAWNITHTTNTEYVIEVDEWVNVTTLSDYVTDVVVAGRVIYFAYGEATQVEQYRYGNNDGSWSSESNALDWYANKLLAYPKDYRDERTVYDIAFGRSGGYSSDQNEPTSVMIKQTPPYWGEPFSHIGLLTRNHVPWDDHIQLANTENYMWKGFPRVNVGTSFSGDEIAKYSFGNRPIDISGAEDLRFAIRAENYDWGAGDIQIGLSDDDGTTIDWFNVPALTQEDDMFGQFTWMVVPFATNYNATSFTIDIEAVTDVLLQLTSYSFGANEAYFFLGQGGVYLGSRDENAPRYEINYFDRINNMIEYAGGAGEVSLRPWIFTEKQPYYVERGTLKPLYIREIEALRDERNGLGVCVNDVYLYFNIGETIQRYYSGQLESIGPDRGYGLPEARRGYPVSLESYPDRVVAAIDADDGTSSILAFNNIGWHELYRAPSADKRIRNVHVRAKESSPDRVFFSEGADSGYIYISTNPETEEGYNYTYESVLETGRIYAGQRGLQKYFHSVELVTEDLDANTTIEVDYKYSGDTSWTPLGTTFNTSPRQKELLSSNYDITGSWIQLRFRIYTSDNAVTPVLVSALLEVIQRQDVNYSYSFNVWLPKTKYEDLNGNKSSTTGDTVWSQLNTWIDNAQPVTLSSVYSDLNGKVCTIEPVTNFRYFRKQIGGTSSHSEVRMFTLNLLEMTS